jgi:hypothetical protein
MKCAPGKTLKSAWEQAKDYGIDVSLLVANRRKTPSERLQQHSRALMTALELQRGMKKHHG